MERTMQRFFNFLFWIVVGGLVGSGFLFASAAAAQDLRRGPGLRGAERDRQAEAEKRKDRLVSRSKGNTSFNYRSTCCV